MNRLFIILIVIMSSFLFSIEQYNHIYLMEFENVDSDFTINNLSRALPDIVIENYKFREDLFVGYLDSIDPYVPAESDDSKQDNALIINGRFVSTDEDVDIDVELYNLSNWELLGKKSFYCPIQNMTCLHDAFLIVIEELLEQYIVAEEEREIGPGQNVTKKIIYSKDDEIDNSEIFKEALSENVAVAEFKINISDSSKETNESQDDELISREFDFSRNKELSKSPIEINTEKLSDILNQFLTNPYDVTIGEMSVELNEYDRDIIDFAIPLEFAINKDLVDNLLSDIPNTIMYNKNGNLSVQFSNNNFVFDKTVITKLATMRYQIIPIYSFVDENQEIQLLIIDTWEKKYQDLLIGDNKILYIDQYVPLYTIKSDSQNIYINLDVNTMIIDYSFSVPYNTFGNYTRLIVDFIKEDKLDQYLNVNWGDLR